MQMNIFSETDDKDLNYPTDVNQSPEAIMDREDAKNKDSVPSVYLPLMWGFLLLLGYFSSLIDDNMPKPLTAKVAGESFSEERAWFFLNDLVGTGPRVAGTKYHLEKTHELQVRLGRIAKQARQKVLVDFQIVSGDFILSSSPPYLNMYNNVTNLIAIIEGKSGFNADGTTNSSILLNCHYDSVPTSPGASDNGIFCAVLLEILSLLSQKEVKFKHNIIFLFNGAEENILQASHGFTQHEWFKGVTGFVNLDAAGTNCKPMLFQMSDTNVLEAYRRSVSYPNAQSMGEVLFASGIIPSDTDYRIFRDYGLVYGIDIAFTKWGHVYHTRLDSLKTIKSGVIQNAGNTLFEITKEMADDPAFYQKSIKSTSVYWDYLNLFMVTYSTSTALYIDLSIVLMAVISIIFYLDTVGYRKPLMKELALSALWRVICLVSGTIGLWLFTVTMATTNVQLRYLARGWLVVPFYWAPFVIFTICTSHLLDHWRASKSGLNRLRRVSQAMASARVVLIAAVIPTLFLCDTATVRYVLTVPLLWMSVTSIISMVLVNSCKIQAWQHLLLELIMATPCLLFIYVLSIKINTLMLPIMGRSPTKVPDYMIGGLNNGVALLSILPVLGIELLFSRRKLWAVLIPVSIVIGAICFYPFSPYSDNPKAPALQRHYWFHSEIRTYNQSNAEVSRKSGIFFSHTEVNTPKDILYYASKNGFNLENTRFNITTNCECYVYCNLPVLSPRTSNYAFPADPVINEQWVNPPVIGALLPDGMWVDFEPPLQTVPETQLKVISKQCHDNVCNITFSIIGPPHTSIILYPRSNVNLTSWTATSDVKATATFENRQVYFVYHTVGVYSPRLNQYTFGISLQVPNQTDSEPILDVSYNAHRIYHPEQFTEEYNRLVNSMPKYYNIATLLSTSVQKQPVHRHSSERHQSQQLPTLLRSYAREGDLLHMIKVKL